jgi:hypothetical protein
LEGIRHSILENKEVAWHLKSHAIWLKEGDNNSKLFHHYANQWKNLNNMGYENEGRRMGSFIQIRGG